MDNNVINVSFNEFIKYLKICTMLDHSRLLYKILQIHGIFLDHLLISYAIQSHLYFHYPNYFAKYMHNLGPVHLAEKFLVNDHLVKGHLTEIIIWPMIIWSM